MDDLRLKGSLSPTVGLSGQVTDEAEISGSLSGGSELTGALNPIAGMEGTLSCETAITGKLSIPERVTPTAYEGPTTVTPTQEQQILRTRDFYMNDNIIVEPIPNNYGLISWNGAVLTVS